MLTGWRERELATSFGRLRSRIITPNESATRLDVRGFHVKDAAAKELLETIGRTFLSGFACAAREGSVAAMAPHLDQVPVRFRGFAYEGAAMCCTILDAMSVRGHRVADLANGPGDGHIYMVYVGMGWAMARLPQFRWRAITATDPLLRWLVLDGYGFHQAYFRTGKYVRGHYHPARFSWPGGGEAWYARRAIDQGIGRALWFVCGTDTDLVAATVDGFPAHRRADLYSGVGLAATYAGGAPEADLLALSDRAGDYRPMLAQGSAFAAEARLRAGLVVPHVDLGTRALCGLTPEQAAKVCAHAIPGTGSRAGDDNIPAYETWRQQVAAEFASAGRD